MASWNEQADFELNSTTPWTFNGDLPEYIPVWILAEETTCHPFQAPSVYRVVYNPMSPNAKMVKLLDVDEDEEGAMGYLSPNEWVILGWRKMTNHGGTFDSYLKSNKLTEFSNLKDLISRP